jgi:hypothetical protein
MIVNTIVVDNFLDNPDAVRQQALSLDFYEKGQFPGLRSDRADEEYEKYVQEKIEKVIGCKITEWSLDSFRFQLCLEDAETWVHKDPSEWAAILYLTPNAPLTAGTGIYDRESQDAELVTGIGNVYNRLVIYRGDLPHRSIMPGFGRTFETGRLTQVFFFRTEHYRG